MKQYLLFFIGVLSISGAFAQTENNKIDTTINLNLLRAPVSPAANLLGISSSEVQRPTDVKGFMVSLQNATQNLASLPSSFAVDIAPYWLGKKGQHFSRNTNNNNNILKSLVLSSAVRNYQSKSKVDSTTQLSFGLRFSLLRGKYDRKDVENINEKLLTIALLKDKILTEDSKFKLFEKARDSVAILEREAISHIINSDSTKIKSLDKERIRFDSLLTTRMNQLQSLTNTSGLKILADSIKAFQGVRLVRTGFKIDLSGGVVWDFPETKFDNGKLLKAGTWLTFGNEWKTGHSVLGILRFLHNPNKVFADDKGVIKNKNVNTLDLGARYNYQSENSPFSGSAEFIFRGSTAKEIENSYRFTINASYEIAENNILTLALGRDFDKTYKNDGNVIAFLNFIKGFGAKNK